MLKVFVFAEDEVEEDDRDDADDELGSISSTCLFATFMLANALTLYFYFTNYTIPNFTITLN